MSSNATIAPAESGTSGKTRGPRPRSRKLPRSSLLATGEPMIWLTGGALVVCLAMIVGLVAQIIVQGMDTFWPTPLLEIRLRDGGHLLGEVTRSENYTPAASVVDDLPEDQQPIVRDLLAASDGVAGRRLLRTGNFELTSERFTWVDDFLIEEETKPEWAVKIERLPRGRAAGPFYGKPVGFEIDGEQSANTAAEAWALYQQHHAPSRERWAEAERLKGHHGLGEFSKQQEAARRNAVGTREHYGADSPQYQQAQAALQEATRLAAENSAPLHAKIKDLEAENLRYQLVMETADGQQAKIILSDVVRAYPANQLTWFQKVGVYFSRWWEFLTDDPREANSEGGVFPAIFGTACMTMLMSLAVVPFGVLAALYLREYAKKGAMVSAVRIAINNLAGVPSIVFGVFGMGFFCYYVGSGVDDWFFPVQKAANNPVFGKGGVLWASFTLALLTLPVVIVATEEALSAVPNSMREGSYACGAGKWQTIWRIVLPRAMPGIMTGMILAMARGAGEVAPLMLVGAAKIAPELAIDSTFPFIHPERSFMHLGFHIYDVGFQSSDSEAAKPMVFTTTLLLIVLIAFLNLAAVMLRTRLRRKFTSSQF
ncbi:MAG: phosphate ABC transporter permease PstA [Pirellulales bacterium]